MGSVALELQVTGPGTFRVRVAPTIPASAPGTLVVAFIGY
jgi:hypothetical protein